MFEIQLKDLGLTDNEIKIYLTLLENGILNPTILAEKTGMHRSYIYDTLDRLLERGIINTVLVNKKKHYQPVNPEVLRQQYEFKLKQLDNIIPQLTGLYKATKEETRVELHRGKDVVKTFLKDLASILQKGDVTYLMGVDEEFFTSVEPIYLEQYFNICNEKNAIEKTIIKKGGKKLKSPHIEYREIDPGYLGETVITVLRNKVYVLIMSTPLHLIIIENDKVANTYKKQFQLLWSTAK